MKKRKRAGELIIANKELVFKIPKKKTSSRTNHNAELVFKMKKKKTASELIMPIKNLPFKK
jgi:hypothetical protein